MLNDNISNFLNSYIENPDPRYAVMLKGKWGCGKTFFIARWLADGQLSAVEAGENDIVLQPIKVSLYGMTKTEQIAEAINRAMHPILYSKGMQVAKNVLKMAGKIVFKTSFDVDGDGHDDGTFSASLDSLSLLDTKDDSIKGVRFLIFDDLERCQIDMKQLLGCINYFVEHCSCHVVIIGDEKHATEEAKAVLKEFKEKTVGREFEVQPDIDAAVDYFLDEDLPHVNWLQTQRDTIIRIFRATGCDNLRILRQCLYDFKVQYLLLSEELLAQDHVVLPGLLGSFIAVYCEFKGEHRDLMKSWNSTYSWAIYGRDDTPERAAIREIQHKYSSEKTGGINVLSTNYITSICYHLESGENITDFIEGQLRQDQAPLTAVGRLDRYYQMENDDFVSLCNEVEDMILRNTISNLYVMGRALSFLAYFHEERLFWFTQALIARVKYYLREAVSPISDKDELYQVRHNYFSGLHSTQSDKPLTVLQDINEWFEKEFIRKAESLYSRMELALLNLSNETVEHLDEIHDHSAPDGRSKYDMKAIFYRLDAGELIGKIDGLSNKNIRTFAVFINRHFMLSYATEDSAWFRKDHNVIAALRDLTAEKVTQTQYVRRYSYEYLLRALDAAEQRCNGERKALMQG